MNRLVTIVTIFAVLSLAGCASRRLAEEDMQRIERALSAAEEAAERSARAAERAASRAEQVAIDAPYRQAARTGGTGKGPVPRPARNPPTVRGRESAAQPLANGESISVSSVTPPTLDPGQELWVVVKADSGTETDPSIPASASMRGRRRDSAVEIPLPLRSTEVWGDIAGSIASLRVRQRFTNPYRDRIEAVYVFPLPADASVTGFIMTIGTRHIRAIVRERAEAEQIYAGARERGYVASLLNEERAGVFKQSVASIEPGRDIDVEITYFDALPRVDGAYEWTFPLAVRQQGDAAPSRPSISLAIDLDAGAPISNVGSPTHTIDVDYLSPGRRRIRLSEVAPPANTDFKLRYELAGPDVRPVALAHTDSRGSYFSLLLEPPVDRTSMARTPMEMIFVVDCSASMSGAPFVVVRETISRSLRRLGPADLFQIVSLSGAVPASSAHSIAATRSNVDAALTHLMALPMNDGKRTLHGFAEALKTPLPAGRLRLVTLLTDGNVEDGGGLETAAAMAAGRGQLVVIAVGSSFNDDLLTRVARVGRAAYAPVGMSVEAVDAVEQFYEDAAHPGLTDIAIEWGDLAVNEVYPKKIPDLFVGRPVLLTGRFRGGGTARVTITGFSAGEPRAIPIDLDLDSATQHDAIPLLWARMKIADLSARAAADSTFSAEGPIRDIGLEYGIASPHTAFLAVDSSTRTPSVPLEVDQTNGSTP